VALKTLDIPREVAIQSVESQAGLLTRRVEISKFQDKAFVDKFIQRYLNKMDEETSQKSGAVSLYSGLLQGASYGSGFDLSGVLQLLQGGSRR
jgi:hypothetical protein